MIKPTHHPHYDDRAALRVSGVSVQYESTLALDNIDFHLKRGSQTAVVGPNGAGKSTLFKVIVGLEKAAGGKVHIYGSEPGKHICIGYIPQRNQVDWDFPVTVYDVVMMGRVGKLGFFKLPGSDDKRLVDEALKLVKMDKYSDRSIKQLSGGQQQRVFIARALAQEAELLLMDEPLAGLDSRSHDEIIRIIKKLEERNVTCLISLHDLSLVNENFKQVMLLNQKIIAFGKPEEVLDRESLANAYGGHLHMIESGGGVYALEDTCVDKGRKNH